LKAASLLRALALAMLVFAATWVAVVLYWRVVGVELTAGHLVLCLLVLPLFLLCLATAVRALLRRRRMADSKDAGAREAVAVPGPGPTPPLHLYAAAAWCRAGSGPAAIAAALGRPVRPPLHPELRDSMGLPVFAAAVEDLDTALVARGLATMPGLDPRDPVPVHALRALALLDPVAEDLLLAALALDSSLVQHAPPPVNGDMQLHPHAIHHSRSAQAPRQAPPPCPLQVHLLLPANWPAALRDAATRRVETLAGALGVPAERIAVEAVAATAASQCWRLLDRLAADSAHHARHVLLAADSMLDPHVVEHLEAKGALLVSGHLEGRIPGESAGGVLLGPPADIEEPPLRVHACCHGAAGRGRRAGVESARLLQAAMEAAALPPLAGTLVFTDADHRPSRAVEAAGAISGALPDADVAEAGRHLGVACGDSGIAAPLVLLATAAGHVRQAGTAALVLGLAGDTGRTAVVISPRPVDGGAGDVEDTPAAGAATA